jgi:hypothetical protein
MSLWRQVKSYRPDSLDLAAHVFVETSQVLSSRFTCHSSANSHHPYHRLKRRTTTLMCQFTSLFPGTCCCWSALDPPPIHTHTHTHTHTHFFAPSTRLPPTTTPPTAAVALDLVNNRSSRGLLPTQRSRRRTTSLWRVLARRLEGEGIISPYHLLPCIT